MRIALINGSPKKAGSATGYFLDCLRDKLGEEHVLVGMRAEGEDFGQPVTMDALVLAFPLYVDGIPSHCLRWMEGAERALREAGSAARVYVIAHNGFFEPEQNRLAIRMCRDWCGKAGLSWGQGLALGGGTMAPGMPMGAGPLRAMGQALDVLAVNILLGESAEDENARPNFPRFLYKRMAEYGWKKEGKKNGLRKADLYAKNI